MTTRSQVFNAIIKWRGYSNRSQLRAEDLYEFNVLIKQRSRTTSEGELVLEIVDTTNPDVNHIVDLINGPNGNTILKMLEVRNSQSCDTAEQ